MTLTQQKLIAHAIVLANNARADLSANADKGTSARPTVAQLNRTLERLASIETTLEAALP